MNYKFGLPVEIIFKCGAVKNINKVIKDNNFKKGIRARRFQEKVAHNY